MPIAQRFHPDPNALSEIELDKALA